MNPDRRGTLNLPGALTAARTARRWALPRLASESTSDRTERALLVLSELVTNASTHGAGPIQVDLAIDEELILVRVTDHGEGTVTLRHPAPDEPGGRGLLIVDEIAERWDVEYARGSTTVWAQLLRS